MEKIIKGLKELAALPVEERMALLNDKEKLAAAWEIISASQKADPVFVSVEEEEEMNKQGKKDAQEVFELGVVFLKGLPPEGMIIALKLVAAIFDLNEYVGFSKEEIKEMEDNKRDKFINHDKWTKTAIEDGESDYEKFNLADHLFKLNREYSEIFNMAAFGIKLEGNAEEVLEEIGRMSFEQKYLLRYFFLREIDGADKKIVAVCESIKTAKEKKEFENKYLELMKETYTYGKEVWIKN
jgi:hypothetical protein